MRLIRWMAIAALAAAIDQAAVAGQSIQTAQGSRVTISGRVVRADTSQPIGGAIVTVGVGAESPGVLTDREGRFVLTDVPAGRTFLRATKTGFFLGFSGRIRPNDPPVAIDTTMRDRFTDVTVRLSPAATVSGRVVGQSAQPVTGVQITVMRVASDPAGSGPTLPVTVQTDAAGRYAVTDLASGEYTITAAQKGEALATGTRVQISGGDDLSGVDLVADHGASTAASSCVIEGRVVDEFGDRVRATVTAVPHIRGDIGRLESGWQSATADAKGRYCLSDLPLGEYFIVAAGEPRVLFQAVDAVGLRQTVARPPTYYPSSPTSAGANTVVVGSGSSISGVDVVVRAVPVGTIGVILQASGRTIEEPQVSIESMGEPYGFRVMSSERHAFKANGVTQGRYTITATALDHEGEKPRRLWGTTEVTSDGATPVQTTLPLEHGARVSGRLVVESGLSQESTPIVWLAPVERRRGESDTDRVGALTLESDGRFSIDDVMPGRYVLHATVGHSLSRRGLVRATHRGDDILDLPIELGPGSDVEDVVLVMGGPSGEVAGKITDENGASVSSGVVVVFADDRRMWSPDSRRIRVVAPDALGRYAFDGLPPGNYRVALLTGSDIKNPRTDLAEMLPWSLAVTITEGQRSALDIRTNTR